MSKAATTTSKFDARKRAILTSLSIELSKERVDERIIPLLEAINSKRNYVSTSSCAGRAILIAIHPSGRKREAKILWKTHRKVKPEDLQEAIIRVESKDIDIIWFLFQPLILHIMARDISSAKELLDAAKRAGFKRVGILGLDGKIVVLIEGHEYIALPIKRKGRVLVDEDYIRELAHQVNVKFERVGMSIQRLLNEIRLI